MVRFSLGASMNSTVDLERDKGLYVRIFTTTYLRQSSMYIMGSLVSGLR